MELIYGDALREMERMEDGVFDAIITDPPYASGAMTKGGREQATSRKYTDGKGRCPYPDFAGDQMDQRSWTHFLRDVLSEGLRVCRPGAVCALTIDWRQLPALTDALQQAGWIWRGTAVWDKVNSRPQRGRFRQQAEFVVWGSKGALPLDRPVPVLPGVIAAPMERGDSRRASAASLEAEDAPNGARRPEHRADEGRTVRRHQTQKPLGLMREIVKICVPGGRVLDPFAGSGTTLLAAQEQGMDAVGIESVQEIYAATKERLRL